MENLTKWLSDDPETRGWRLAAQLIVHAGGNLPANTFEAAWQAIAESSFRGGREAAVEQLQAIDPIAYGRSRNHVGGAVTRLSPWLRHGVLSLAEVRDAALARVRERSQAEKLVSELGWRDYWQRVYAARPESV